MDIGHRAPGELRIIRKRLDSLTEVPEVQTPTQEPDTDTLLATEEEPAATGYYLSLLKAHPPVDPNEYHALKFTPKQWEQRNSTAGRLALQRERQARLAAIQTGNLI